MHLLKKKFLFFLSGIIILSSFATAQNGPKAFGDVSLEELELKSYEKDPAAAALVLFDKGDLEVDQFSTKGWNLNRHIRVKILKQSAVEEWSNIKVLVPKNGFKNLEGSSYNLENGAIVKSELDQTSVFEKKYDKYTDEITFVLPNVKEGSVIEYSYTEVNGSLYLPRWEFQDTDPTLWSEYSFFYSSSDIVPHVRGTIPVIREEIKYEGKYQKWVAREVPAFKEEPLMPDMDAYLSSIEFTNKRSSWLGVYHQVRSSESFSDIIYKKNYSFLKKRVDETTEGITDPMEKIKAISNYVKQNIQWNGVNDFYADDPVLVFNRKTGSSGDLNLILAAMLNKAGFNVNMVLLSTRDNGYLLEDYPWRGRFNYVVCELTLNNERLLLDATEKFLPFDMLPARCFNHKGFLMTKEQYGWISVEPKKYDKISVEAALALTEAGEVEGEVSLVSSEYAAYKARQKFESGEAGEEVHGALKSAGWKAVLLERENLEDIEKTLIEKYKLKVDQHAIVTKDLIYFNPHIFLRVEENPFKLSERLYPVDFEVLEEKTVVTKITIPEGFSVEELPENAAFVLPGNAVKFISSISQSGNQIMVMSRVQINKTLFQPFEYLELKEIYDQIVAKQSENVVLKRL